MMQKHEYLTRDTFYCSCFESSHVLTVTFDNDDYTVDFAMVRNDGNFWRRLKEIVNYLWKGDIWYYSDVMLDKEEYNRFKEFLDTAEKMRENEISGNKG